MFFNAHSCYSLRYGVVLPDELLQIAQNNGCRHLVLADINSVSACIPFLKNAPQYTVNPIVGVDCRNGAQRAFILIAKNNAGFERINAFLTHLLHTKKPIPTTAPQLNDVYVVYPFQYSKKLTKNEFIGLELHDASKLKWNKQSKEKWIILPTLSFRNQRDYNTHRILRAIENNTLISKLTKNDCGDPREKICSKEAFRDHFGNYPDLIENTNKILESCKVNLDFTKENPSQNQQTYTGSETEDIELLKQLVQDGIPYRYPTINEEIVQRIEKELEMIVRMKFVAYFLINWDIINYAQQKGFFYVGRGSGANSVIAYLLRITDVDPIELDLYFERFINIYRSSPPDFDIDFSWKDREDITQYIFKRFSHVALVGTYNTFQRKGVLRELGKVFGMPKYEIDQLSKGKKPISDLEKRVIQYGEYIHGLPNTLSVHSCGIIISNLPISTFSATFMPPKGYPTIQFDMYTCEDIGWHKFDILSQRGLSKIKDSLSLIAKNQGVQIDIHDTALFKQDNGIREILKSADVLGCFYVESPAMRMLLTKLEVETYIELVAASSVIRPGVAQSGMMQEYIRRKRNPEDRKRAHPVLFELMPETFGVMVYQEDVIKVANVFAGLGLGEADKMRRGMSGKFRSNAEFESVRVAFFESALKKGRKIDETEEIWRQIKSFAGYAFAKGHSASYAVESYQCMYLKAYFPLEFMVATINNSGGFYHVSTYITEAKKHKGIIEAPCVNRSNYLTEIYGNTIYLGFHLLHSLRHQVVLLLEDERKKNGPFNDFIDFIERVPISLEQITLLIRINAFRFTGKNKRTLLWEAHLRIDKTETLKVKSLFQTQQKHIRIPSLQCCEKSNAFDQIELLGFSLFPPELLLKENTLQGTLQNSLKNFIGKNTTLKLNLITIKRAVTSKGEHMFFGAFLDEKNQWVDTVHFPPVANAYPFRGLGMYQVTGKVVQEFGFISIEVSTMNKLSMIEDPRYSEIKDDKEITTNNRRKNYAFNNNQKTKEWKEQ